MQISLVENIKFPKNNIIVQNNQFIKPMYDSFELSFCANNRELDLEPAMNISGIHCPGCGVKMFSKQDYKELVKKASKIETTTELVKLLNDYKQYIPNNMRDILLDTESPEKYENLTINEYFKNHREAAFIKRRTRIHKVKDYLIDEYSKNFPIDKQSKIIETALTLTSRDKYQQYKQKITDMLNYLDLSPKELAIMKNFALKDIATSDIYYGIFKLKEAPNMQPSELSKIIVERIFQHSLNNMEKIENYENFENILNNNIILCDTCKTNSSKNVFWRNFDQPRLKDNIKLYLGDISYLIGEGQLGKENNYIKSFCHLCDVLSKHNINFQPNEIEKFYTLITISSRHENFEPIMQTKVDVPCAGCGSTLLPHPIRKNIQDDLYYCNKPSDYAKVLKKYQKYIGLYSNGITKIFLDIVDNNPEISNEEFMQIYQKKVTKFTKNNIKNAILNLKKERLYYVQNNKYEELKNIDIILKRANDYIKSGKMHNYVYKDFYEYCMDSPELNGNYTKTVFTFFDDIKKICYKYTLSRQKEELDINDKDPVYTMVYNIFKPDIGTTDHLVAISRGGTSDKKNLIGLCKGCNTLKNRKTVNAWYSQNLSVRHNFLNHIKTIDDMSKNGELDGYDGWAKYIADKMFELTYGKFDMRSNFE